MLFSAAGRLTRVASLAVIVLATPFSLHAQVGRPLPSAELGVIHCSVAASVPLVRIEGTRELVGDVLLSCHNASPTVGFEPKGFVEADISLSLNVDISNRIGYGLGPDVTDAVLVVNENHCPVSSPYRTFGNCGSDNETVQDPMPARLDPARPRTLRWTGVAIPIPGAAIPSEATGAVPVANCAGRFGVPGGCHPRTTIVRLTNIRANAAQLGASGDANASAVAVEASLSVEPSDATLQLEDSLLRLAEAGPGLMAAVRPFDADRLCSHGETRAEITISEGFAAAFKASAQPSFRPGDPGWEDGYYPYSGAAEEPSSALTGTRVSVALSGLPDGVEVAAPTAIACSSAGLELRLVEGASGDGSGGVVTSGAAVSRPVGTGEASDVSVLYEVTGAGPLVREQCRIPLRLSRSETANGLVRGGQVTVSASLGPVGRPGFDVSQFVSSKPALKPTFRLSTCGTTLFFPFVTNRSNFDTAIVIANTSADPLGSRHQAGRCMLRYHRSGVEGQTEPSVQNTIELVAGKQLAFTLSSGNAAQGIAALTDFQGYLVAECEFQHAQGFVFVTEQVNGTAILAQGYLAEIVRDRQDAGTGSDGP
jgi:hypothetical protein